MTIRTLVPTFTLGFLLFSGVANAQTTPHARITKEIDESNTVAIGGNVHPLVASAQTSQPADDSTPMEHMILYLKGDTGQEAQLEQMIAQQHDPKSPLYHHYLSTEQFAGQFGVAQSDIDTVVNWLQSHGFTVEKIPAGNRSIIFGGTAGQVSSAFKTEIRRYNIAGTTHLANASDPQIPAALADTVGGIVKLHDFRHGHSLTPVKSLTAAAGTPQFTSGSSHYLSPSDYGIIYDINPLYSAGVNGTGQTIAIIARSNIYPTDVESFRSNMGLKANNPQYVITNSDPGVLEGDSVETTLDTEWSGAVAPGATIKVIISASTTADGIDLSSLYAVNNNVAPIISLSYGSCEAAMGSTEMTFYNSLWKQAAAQGQTVLVAAGDSGAAGCGAAAYGKAINGLCSSPYSTCVGGTEFAEGSNPGQYWLPGNNTVYGSAISYIPETVWNESGDVSGGSGIWAGGGGASITYPKPSWQTGRGVPADGARDVPDLSLTAAGHDGYLIWLNGSLNTVGGTSAATPSLAGMIALLDQKTNTRQGLINTTIYPLATKQASGGPAIFHDTTTGNNSVPGLTGFSATAGYDEASGLGSVDATLLVNNWTAQSASPSLTLSAASSSVTLLVGKTASTVITATATSLNAAVAFTVSGAPTGLTAALSTASIASPGSGTVTLNLTASTTIAPGTYSLTIKGVGASQTATVAVSVVIPAPTFTLSASSSSLTVAAGSSVQDSITLASQNGFSSTAALSASGLPTGITAAFSPTTIAGAGGTSNITFTVAKTVAAATYKIQISAAGGGITQSVSLSLVVPAPPSCTLSAIPTIISMLPGQTAASQISCTSVQGTFSAPLTLSLSGAPSGLTAKAAASSIAAGGSTNLSVVAASTLAAGNYSVTLTATSGTFTQSLAIPISVVTPTFTLSASSTSAPVVVGNKAQISFTATPQNGFSSALSFSVSGLPTGVTASFATSSLVSTLTLSAGSTAKAGSSTLTITATGGGVTKTATVTLVVSLAPLCTLALNPTAVTVAAGASSSATLSCAVTQGAFTSPLSLSISGAPAGMTVTAPSSMTAGAAANLAIGAALSTTAGKYNLSLTATASGYAQSLTIPVTVSPANTFSLAVSEGQINAVNAVASPVTATVQAFGIFNSAVAFHLTGLPTGVTAAMTNTNLAAPGNGSSVLTFAISSTAKAGTYPLTLTATGGTVTQTAALNLVISLGPSFSLALNVPSITVAAGSSGTITSSTGNYINGFNGQLAMTFSGVPSGVNYSLVTANAANNLVNLTFAFSVPSSLAAGTYPITVTDIGNSGSTATGNGVTRTATFNLIVTAAAQAKH